MKGTSFLTRVTLHVLAFFVLLNSRVNNNKCVTIKSLRKKDIIFNVVIYLACR